jgi:hypothetical protein
LGWDPDSEEPEKHLHTVVQQVVFFGLAAELSGLRDITPNRLCQTRKGFSLATLLIPDIFSKSKMICILPAAVISNRMGLGSDSESYRDRCTRRDVVAQWSRHRAGRRLIAGSNPTPERYRRRPCGVAWTRMPSPGPARRVPNSLRLPSSQAPSQPERRSGWLTSHGLMVEYINKWDF